MTEKNTVISEIEENLLFVSANSTSSVQKPPPFDDDVLSLCTDRDNLVTGYALDKVLVHGLDSRFMSTDYNARGSSSNNKAKSSSSSQDAAARQLSSSRVANDAIIDGQIDAFLSRLELTDYGEYISTDDDDELLPRERIKAIKLPKSAFEPLLAPLRSSRPPLYQALIQHHLISGHIKGKRRSSKKKDKDNNKSSQGGSAEKNKDKESSSAGSKPSGKISSRRSSNSLDDDGSIAAPLPALPQRGSKELSDMPMPRSQEYQKEVLAVIVAKAVAEGTVSSFLIAISLLLRLLKLDDKTISTSHTTHLSGAPLSSVNALPALPIGNVIASLFESVEISGGKDSIDANISNVALPNPFKMCLIPNGSRSDSPSCSDISRDESNRTGKGGSESGSVSVSHSLRSQSASIGHSGFVGAVSDAGSTAGSTHADMGTMSQSAGDGDSEEAYNHSEEFLLAQALALSITPASIGSSGRNNNSAVDVASSVGVGSLCETSSIPDSVSGSVAEYNDESEHHYNPYSSYHPSNPIPDNLPNVPDLSTWGPFCNKGVWQTLCSYQVGESALSSISLRNIIFALLTVICSSADDAIIDTAKDENISTDLKTDLKTAYLLKIDPHPLVFLLIEMLMDFLTAELRCHTSGQPIDPTSNPVAYNDWFLHCYFLLWCLTSLINVTKVHLSQAIVDEVSPSSLGLGLVGGMNSGTVSSSNSSNSESLGKGRSAGGSSYQSSSKSGGKMGGANSYTPFVLRLLQRIADCMGLDKFIAGSHDNIIDGAMKNYSFARDSNEFKLKVSSHRHAIRMIAIDTFVSGLKIFRPNLDDRIVLLENLFAACPFIDEIDFKVQPFDTYTYDASSGDDSTTSDDDSISKSGLCSSYYKLYVLQQTCKSFCSGGNVAINYVNSYHGRSSRGGSREGSPLLRTSRPSQETFFPSSAISDNDPSESSEDKLADEQSSFNQCGDNNLYSNIEHILINRLGCPTLMSQCVVSNSSQVSENDDGSESSTTLSFTDTKTLFWGEMQLLKSIQLMHIEDFKNSVIGAAPSSPNKITFSSSKCNRDIIVSDSGKVASYRSTKAWGSIAACTAFPPLSGTHEWTVFIDKCDRGHAFVGVISGDASMDTYIGGDEFGWGLIGTKSAWHNERKVKSDIGPGFTSQSVVNLRLDTDHNSLYLCVGPLSGNNSSEWILAFNNLPAVPLFPAISMHHRDDKIVLSSVVSEKQSPSQSLRKKVKFTDDLKRVIYMQRKFVSFTQHIISKINDILAFFDVDSDSIKTGGHPGMAAILAHPFIGLFLPSLASAVIRMRSSAYVGFAVVQLLPQFILMSKKVAAVADFISKKYITASSNSRIPGNRSSDIDIEGIWSFRCTGSTVGSTAQQEYRLDLTVEDALGATLSSASADEPGSAAGPVGVSGNGTSTSASATSSVVTCQGTLFGTRLKMSNNWKSSTGTNTIVDGRITLCGGFFSGTILDSKSSKLGAIEGVKIHAASYKYSLDDYTRNVLMKCSLVCVMASSKLTANLVIGLNANPDDGSCIADDDLGIDTITPINDSKSGDTDSPSTADAETKLTNDIQKWASSELFSGGLPLDSTLLSYLSDELKLYSHKPIYMADLDSVDDNNANPMTKKAARVDYPKSSDFSNELLNWWLSSAFPTIGPYLGHSMQSNSSGVSSDFHYRRANVDFHHFEFPSSPSNAPSVSLTHITDDHKGILREVASGRENGKRIDEYVLTHIGQSSLSKVGGEVVLVTRKLVLAAMIKHSGCARFCHLESEQLRNGSRNTPDRPYQLLVDIWRAVQRVVEHTIRMKQSSGLSYGDVCKALCSKAQLLLYVECNSLSTAVGSSLDLVSSPPSQALKSEEADAPNNPNPNPLEADRVNDFNSLLSTVVEFFMSSFRSVPKLYVQLKQSAYRAICRVAGLKTFVMISSKCDVCGEAASKVIGKMPSLTSISLQSVSVEYIFLSLHGLTEVDSTRFSISRESGGASSNGHYTSKLEGASSKLLMDVKTSFETVYEHITQLLSRCTWAWDRDGQSISLSAWGLNIRAEDHLFLNRTGIFRVLQMVLDDARNCMSSRAEKAAAKSIAAEASIAVSGRNTSKGVNSPREDRGGPYSAEFTLNTSKRLAQLVLRVVHALASQVAFSKDMPSLMSSTNAPSSNTTITRRLQKIPSGPDTLSQSLFDMLYSELFSSMKNMILSQSKLSSKALNTLKEAPPDQDEFLDGEQYIYRILRLLYFVSNSKICQCLLSSPKWFTLLLMGIGVGGLGIQRRILRLLRRLLINMDPDKFVAYIPSLFHSRNEILEMESALTDEGARAYINNQRASLDDRSVSFAELLVNLFLEGVSVIIPATEAESSQPGSNTKLFLDYLSSQSTGESLSAESLLVLRVLQGVPSWRQVIDTAARKVLSWDYAKQVDSSNNGVLVVSSFCFSDEKRLRMSAAALGIYGGYFDKVRVGGIGAFKPFSLIGLADTLANRLIGISRTCGMIVSITDSIVEMVLMERGIRYLQSTSTPPGGSSIQHTTSMATTLPVVTVKLNRNDVLPSFDVPVIADFVSMEVMDEMLKIVDSHGIPWLLNYRPKKPSVGVSAGEGDSPSPGIDDPMDDEKRDESMADGASSTSKLQLTDSDAGKAELESMQVFTITSLFRALALSMQSQAVADRLLDNPSVARALLALSSQDSGSGGLCVLENIEESWARIWQNYSFSSGGANGKEDPYFSVDSNSRSASSFSRDNASIDRDQDRPLRSMIEAAIGGVEGVRSLEGRTLLEAAVGLFVPAEARQIDAAAQQAAINQMVDIGLPREWCDVALRRCRWNVEMAINMCFEHGAEMSQIVMEDAMIQAVTSSRQESGSGLERVINRASTRRAPADSSALIRQLLEMGFPPSWCSRAMTATGNNVDAALSWILSHGEELVADEGGNEAAEGSDAAAAEGSSAGAVVDIVNPLSVLSGACQIKDETTLLVSATSSGGFPSVGCRGYAVSSGKWYYEATLHTAGCVQIGWADCSFEGLADNGHGVGDCNASWAYDGWRMYLWHETSADWGARWAVGDVLGCAVDLDTREMFYYLNGYGVEIDMGKAFDGFTYHGGLFPSASLSQKESISFNFGSEPFAHAPPSGFRPFVDHVLSTQCRSLDVSKQFVNQAMLKYIITPKESTSSDQKSSSGESHLEKLAIEDAMEEFSLSSNGKDTDNRRRYFTNDDSRSSSTLPSLPQPNIPAIPRDRAELLELFKCVSKDLCILYARTTVLRLLSSLPSLKSEKKSRFLELLLPQNRDTSDASNDASSGMSSGAESLLNGIRLAAHSSTRTKIFLSVMALLPSSAPIPNNLGSLYSVGGSPMLAGIRQAVASLLSQSRAGGGDALVYMLLDQVLLDCLNSRSRDVASAWSGGEGCCAPMIFKDTTMSHKEYLSHPALHLATFYTSLLIDQFAVEINGTATTSIQNKWAEISPLIVTLTRHWVFVLQSPSSAVRGCSIRMLSTILQEFSQLGGRFITAPQNIISTVSSYIPLKRLEDIALTRLVAEKSTAPVCSDYLQCLLDLVIACRQALSEDFTIFTKNHNISSASDKKDRISDHSGDTVKNAQNGDDDEITYLESSLDDSDAEFSWEAIQGRIFSDNGWQIMTGHLTQHRIPKLPPPDKKPVDRQENPPELLIGCKVVKTVTVVTETDTEVPWELDESAIPPPPAPFEEGLEASLVAAIQAIRNGQRAGPTTSPASTSTSNSVSTSALDSEASLTLSPQVDSPKTKIIKKIDTSKQDIIGTVTEIGNWVDSSDSVSNNYHVGSARLVKWDLSGETELVRWGADGIYDVSHVKSIKNGKVTAKYPLPLTKMSKLVSSNFGCEVKFGVILRLRTIKNSMNSDFESKLVGLLELPDFNAVVLVSGECFSDGSCIIEERKLLAGPRHSSWGVRFGHKHWRKGTKYTLKHSAFSDPSDRFDGSMAGGFEYSVDAKPLIGRLEPFTVTGDIYLQKSQLFRFDEKMHPANISVSVDGLAATKLSGSGQACVYGTVGFTSGVHFWEFKIDQADQGSVFLGVAEKPGPPGTSQSSRCNRWMGYGYVNHRASLRTATQHSTDILKVYGDHFHTGDTVGVMLDMDRGRLNFFLDGLKYGEHIIADLGDAFTDLSTPHTMRPRALFPVVGLSKSQDLVALSPRWMSSIGVSKYDEFNIVTKAWGLISSWNFDRPTSMPCNANLWAYRYAWRDWCSWLSGRHVRVRSRCKSSVLLVAVDVTPLACIDACIRVGLRRSLFKGDRIVFDRTCGRVLDTSEEAVILGAHKGHLWYRLDTSSSNSDSIMESTSLAWTLVAHDVGDIKLLRRGKAVEKLLPLSVIERPLPRSPAFHGGLISILHAGGAMMRNGIEIDTSDALITIPQNTVLFATEKRVNSSNITRYRVLFEGKYGWISERMRGSNEELMIAKVSTATKEELRIAREGMYAQAEEHGIDVESLPLDVSSVREAVQRWCDCVRESNPELFASGAALNPSSPRNDSNYTFDKYLELATTVDGCKQWPVEADMQLAEIISKCATDEGVTPPNLPWQSLERYLRGLEGLSATTGQASPLSIAPVDRVIARAALLRVTNQAIFYALPYLGLLLPEERLRKDICGHAGDVDIVPTSVPDRIVLLPSSGGSEASTGSAPSIIRSLSHVSMPQRYSFPRPTEASVGRGEGGNGATNNSSLSPCAARRIRSLRRVLFSQTKSSFWEQVLEATSTPTAMHQDEYEDPREIKVLKINRIKATPSRLAAIAAPAERQRQSVFGQMHKEMRSWTNSAFRRSYVGKGHGGQKRAFKVKFVGEGVNDYGGPYRALFEQIVDELQNDSFSAMSKTLLPLLLPCPNRSASVGSNQDKFVLSASQGAPTCQELMHFLGKLIGTAVRHNLTLGLNLSSLVWRPLVSLPLARAHLDTVDTLTTKHLEVVTRLGLELEQKALEEEAAAAAGAAGMGSPSMHRLYTSDYRPDEWLELTFTLYLPDSTRHALVPGGEDLWLTLGNWREYVELVERLRLRESVVMFKALRDGMACVLPSEILPLFTSGELEQLISGNSKVDISSLKKITEYEDIDPLGSSVQNFWEILEEMTDEERTLFLRFVWARSRMPSSQESCMNFKIQGVQGEAKEKPDQYLPYAQTCFFSLSLPPYSSKDIMRAKLLYAINNSPNMDADIKLHNAEGWAE